jgi:phytoene dehydrogenase-like protein
MDKATDIVVIGAGIAGLSAAATLARAGRKTVVFEQHLQPGGYWSSFVRQGIVFDITPHWTIDPERVNAMLADHGVGPLEFENRAHVGRYLGPEPGWDIWVSADRQRFEASVLASFPGASRAALARLEAICREIFASIDSVPSRNLELAGPLARLGAILGMALKLRKVLRYARLPAEAFLEAFFPGESLRGLRTLLALTAPIPDIPAIGVIAMLGIALRSRAFSPVGGAQAVGDAFALAAKASGAQILHNRRVTRILVEGGRVVGVELEDGSRVQAGRVVAAMDAKQLFYGLLDPSLMPAVFRRKLDAYPPSDPYVILSLVTDLDPAAFGFEGTDTFVAPSPHLKETLAPNDPERGFYELVFPRFRRPEADPRHHGLQIVAPATFGHEQHWRSGPGLERGEAYRRLKRSYADALLRRVESRIPGLREHILHLDIATPLTMYRYTLNDRGAPVGWGYKNPLRWKQRVAFLPGLYQAGHWVGPSGLVSAATSGKHAAELVLHDLEAAFG